MLEAIRTSNDDQSGLRKSRNWVNGLIKRQSIWYESTAKQTASQKQNIVL